MKLYILNEELQRIQPINVYESVTWESFYREEGNFTLKLPLNLFKVIVPEDDSVVFIENTEESDLGIVESVEKTVGDNNNKLLVIKGRLASCILESRVSIGSNVFKDSYPRDILKTVLEDNFLSPKDTLRAIDILDYQVSEQPILSQVNYELLRGIDGLQITKDVCEIGDCGFSMGLKELSNGEVKLQFRLYKGVNRSLGQYINKPFVIQQKGNSVVQIDYFKSSKDKRTFAEIDKEYNVRTTYPKTVEASNSGLHRKETYIDLSSVSQTIILEDGTEVVIEDQYYENMIQNEVAVRMSSLVTTEYLDADLNALIASKYKKEVFLGDTITIKDEELGFFSDIVLTGATEVWSNKGYEVSLQIGTNTVKKIKEVY